MSQFTNKDYFNNLGIYNCVYSKQIIDKLFIHENYNLSLNYDINKPCLFIGCFWNEDYKKISNHNSDKYLLWLGDDIEFNNNIFIFDDINHFTLDIISNELLSNKDIESKILNLDITQKIYINKINFHIRDYVIIFNSSSSEEFDLYFKNNISNLQNIIYFNKIEFNNLVNYLPYVKYAIVYNYTNKILKNLIAINLIQKFHIPIFSNDTTFRYQNLKSFNPNISKNIIYKKVPKVNYDYLTPNDTEKIINLNNNTLFSHLIEINENLNISSSNNNYFKNIIKYFYPSRDINVIGTTTNINDDLSYTLRFLFNLDKSKYNNNCSQLVNLINKAIEYNKDYIFLITKKINNLEDIISYINNQKIEIKHFISVNDYIFIIHRNFFGSLKVLLKLNLDWSIVLKLINFKYNDKIHNINYKINNLSDKYIFTYNELINLNIKFPYTETTILLPIYNGTDYLKIALESIENQSYKNYKVIVIDDGSTDNSLDIVLQSKIENLYIIQNDSNSGISKSLNNGIKFINSDFFTWTSHDNILENNMLEVLVNNLKNSSNSMIISSHQFTGYKSHITPCINKKIDFLTNFTGVCSFLFKSDIVNKIGLYDEELKMVEDWDYLLRIIQTEDSILTIDEVLYKYRLHDKQLSVKYKNLVHDYEFKMYNKLLTNGIEQLLINFIDDYKTISNYEKSIKFIKFCNDIISNKKKSIKSTIGKYIPDIYLLAYELNHDVNTLFLLNKWASVNKNQEYKDICFKKLNEHIDKYILIKSKNLFLYYSSVDYFTLVQRPHQILRHFCNSYIKIFRQDNLDSNFFFDEKYNVIVLGKSYFNLISEHIYKNKNNIIIYHNNPDFYSEIKNLNINKIILYDLIDAPIDEFNIWNNNLQNAVNNSNIVIYSHPELINYLKQINPTKEYYYLSNACEYELFSKAKNRIYPRPDDIPITNKPILGYYGAFSNWIDYNLIKQYADSNKYHILMIGGLPNNLKYNIRFEHKNITWLDHKPYEELPIYLSWFDKCFLPFKDCELNKYVNPCKYWEYLASGKEIFKHNINIESKITIDYKDITQKILLILNSNSKLFTSIHKLVKLHNLQNLRELLTVVFSENITYDFENNIYEKINNRVEINNDLDIKFIINLELDKFINSITLKYESNFDDNEIKDIIKNNNYDTIYELNNIIYNFINQKLIKKNNKVIEYNKPVIILFSMIDYYFRIQRHQHICRILAERGYRIFYIRTSFKEDYNEDIISENLIEINLDGNPSHNVYNSILKKDDIDRIIKSIDRLKIKYAFNYFISFVANPFWNQVLKYIPNTSIIYDCVDFHEGFGNIHQEILNNEKDLLINCDSLILTSKVLADKLNVNKEYSLVRNGCQFDYFNNINTENNKIIGYYGAISDWFDYKIIEEIANKYDDYEIHLIGNVWCVNKDHEKKIKNLSRFNNIRFFGEIPYKELHKYLSKFTIGLIPFIINDLIECTNPVKLYEMMAIGIPVVLTNITDVHHMIQDSSDNFNHLFYVSKDMNEFLDNIDIALNNLNNDRRKEFAVNNSWDSRVDDIIQIINKVNPLISITLLCYNNWKYTKRCIDSIYENSNYNYFELVLIDNDSKDETNTEVKFYLDRNNFRYIRNKDNYGFAKGMNIGTLNMSGEYMILLNNDTYCSKDWLYPLVKNLFNQNIGIVSPITNNCGSEGKQFINYTDYIDCVNKAKIIQKEFVNNLIPSNNVPFFGPALRKQDAYSVGLLDINYGRGGWEDDDFIKRISIFKQNYNNYCAYNSFVFHEESLTLGKEHFQKHSNLNYYQTKWNQIWRAPKYYFPEININCDVDNEMVKLQLNSILKYNIKIQKDNSIFITDKLNVNNSLYMNYSNNVFEINTNNTKSIKYIKEDFDMIKFYGILFNYKYGIL